MCVIENAKETTSADFWTSLAKKLKAPLKNNEVIHKAGVMDFLGAQGWELVSHASLNLNPGTVTHQYHFKRRIEK